MHTKSPAFITERRAFLLRDQSGIQLGPALDHDVEFSLQLLQLSNHRCGFGRRTLVKTGIRHLRFNGSDLLLHGFDLARQGFQLALDLVAELLLRHWRFCRSHRRRLQP